MAQQYLTDEVIMENNATHPHGVSSRTPLFIMSARDKAAFNTEAYEGKMVRVRFQGGREVVGVLKGYDSLMNLVLDDAVEYLRDIDDEYMPSGETRKLGRVVCRGIAIMEMNPVEGMIE
ncbi:hypothetical protein WA538_001072, partial [Blastocystis sp. DL]